jgi:hypothetical protein
MRHGIDRCKRSYDGVPRYHSSATGNHNSRLQVVMHYKVACFRRKGLTHER